MASATDDLVVLLLLRLMRRDDWDAECTCELLAHGCPPAGIRLLTRLLGAPAERDDTVPCPSTVDGMVLVLEVGGLLLLASVSPEVLRRHRE
ncbi:hypothetical protein [Nocardioides sp. cx-173]|uniref:hypothetical protein n=1 Tax=Nocardioides sp. cx-173 TaxID=2898796 RepID=UPI001E38A69F|nr:hypothetical protein [Nocardioides sp. cx-173]MCD4523794.1 hypothetical protein [Nocardioides sp. cx-173]UGB41883.1 hypothetical protein LQ940_21365 [Nocardioides sp. cx-173]